MNQICIPFLGESITLAKPWTFNLHAEHRNLSLLDFFHLSQRSTETPRYSWDKVGYYKKDVYETTLPVGTILVFDRFYIRQNKPEYDSVTFVIKKGGILQNTKQLRFWAKLTDVNNIKFEGEIGQHSHQNQTLYGPYPIGG